YVSSVWGTADPNFQMESLGNDLYKLAIGYPHEFYGCPETEQILQLAFVFRSANGSITGRDVGGADIFMDLFSSGLTVAFIEPSQNTPFQMPERSPIFYALGDSLDIMIGAATIETQIEQLKLHYGETELAVTTNDTLAYTYTFNDEGLHYFYAIAVDTAGLTDTTSLCVMVNPTITDAIPPNSFEPGIHYNGPTSVTLQLFAPYKEFVYVIGDFNDWMVDTTFLMNRYQPTTDSTLWWITLENISAGVEQAFQYLVDGDLRIADPYTDKVLDGWNDGWITNDIYPNLKDYPWNKTADPVSILQTVQQPYNWLYSAEYERVSQEKLVIYELLPRDFLADHDYETIIDTLDYLDRLGINAIELMPVNEFEGNSSWGYNPSFYFAPDKYYGPKNDLKTLIDECHNRGIAVIIDMVLNHSYGQSPLARLYWNSSLYRPAANNPWYNETSNFQNPDAQWGNDFNHESIHTEAFVKRVNDYWLTEYKVDGFRYDFTKGFSNTIYPPSSWGSNYDVSRISNLKRIADEIWETDSTAYFILEHLADNSEETELANYGMMLWGNMNYSYNEATMGWLGNSDFSWGYYGSRGWSEPNLVTYMESHDEERTMFKNLEYGNHSGAYDIRDLPTALQRMKLAGAFFFTYPGPKMIWQFGERGYDISIDDLCRLCEKPPRWEYMLDEDRLRLFKTWKALITLRKEHETFTSPETNVELWLNSSTGRKRIKLTHDSMNAIIVGNFGVNTTTIGPDFHHTGIWYEYFSGDSLNVQSTSDVLELAAGEFNIFTTVRIDPPEAGLLSINSELTSIPVTFQLYQNYPNPFNPETTIRFSIPTMEKIHLAVYDIQGRLVKTLVDENIPSGNHSVKWSGTNAKGHPVASGMYIYKLKTKDSVFLNKMMLLK
ncbi:MAG: T9SS type A sorting domain-containing protein, partial [Candidatus Marinimicrobia bacterium]|nr:T9SS type A sorting domain-containing protein [Candidatus Neomarinimicrobiota bacterium]